MSEASSEISISTSRGGYDDGPDTGKPYNEIHLQVFGFNWRIRIPEIIKPIEKWVTTEYRPVGKVMSSHVYVEYTKRCYGVRIFGNHFNIMYGSASDNSREEQRWSCFLPWQSVRFIRTSHYDRDGKNIVLTHWDATMRTQHGRSKCDIERAEVEALDNRTVFAFLDYDGQEILATVRVDEREWRRGTGWFKWLSLFTKRRIEKSLSIEFNEEVGPEKGSWKGGTCSQGIGMEPGEGVRHCWARYCDKYNLKPVERSHLEIQELMAESNRRKAKRRAEYAALHPEHAVAKAVPNV